MRHNRILFVVGLLLTMSVVGEAQQVPQAPTAQQAAVGELITLMRAQTGAIQALRARLLDLEARVRKLESESPSAVPTPQLPQGETPHPIHPPAATCLESGSDCDPSLGSLERLAALQTATIQILGARVSRAESQVEVLEIRRNNGQR